MGIRDTLLGLVRGSAAMSPAETPAALPPRMILGATAAPELCMLPVDGGWDATASIQAKNLVQLKVDGICGLYLDRVVTREGTPLDCALHCQPGLRRLEEAFGHEMFFHGEYAEEDGFNATLAAQGRRQGEGTFWIFDAIPRGAWITGGSDIPLIERLSTLKERFEAAAADLGPFVGMLNWWELDGQATIAKAAELWALGYEGIVSKRPDSPYIRNRSSDWFRLKHKTTVDVQVIDVVAPAGKLKKIIVRGPDDIGPITVGNGWDGVTGAAIAERFRRGGSIVVEISYQLTTGKKRSVRGATFHRLRLDKENVR